MRGEEVRRRVLAPPQPPAPHLAHAVHQREAARPRPIPSSGRLGRGLGGGRGGDGAADGVAEVAPLDVGLDPRAALAVRPHLRQRPECQSQLQERQRMSAWGGVQAHLVPVLARLEAVEDRARRRARDRGDGRRHRRRRRQPRLDLVQVGRRDGSPAHAPRRAVAREA